MSSYNPVPQQPTGGQPQQPWQPQTQTGGAQPPMPPYGYGQPPAPPQPPKKKRRWPWIAGVATLAVFGIGGCMNAMAGGSTTAENPVVVTQPSEAPTTEAPSADPTTQAPKTQAPKPAPKTTAPKPKPAPTTQAPKPAPKPKPSMTNSQEQAIGAAEDYLASQAFSRKGLIDQLSSEYGSGFSKADAKFAVNHIKVNWNEQAAKAAQEYLDSQHFSRSGLIQQLESPYGSQFTHSQAVYGVNKAGL